MKLPDKIVPDEEWKPINPDYVNGVVDTYLVSNYGRVYNWKEERLLKPTVCSNHLTAHLRVLEDNGKTKDVTKPIQRLMMTSFNPVKNFENLEVGHIDNCSFNNQLDNLQWLTREENMRKERESLHGRSKCYKRNGLSESDFQFNDNIIRKICDLLSNTKLNCIEIANIVGVSYRTVLDIKNKKLFTNISRNYDFLNRR